MLVRLCKRDLRPTLERTKDKRSQIKERGSLDVTTSTVEHAAMQEAIAN